MNIIGRYWNSFVHVATALCTLFSGFLVEPPFPGPQDALFKFGRFAIAVCIGLWFVPERVWRQRKHRWKWWAVAILITTTAIGTFLYYTDLLDRCSVAYCRDRRVVVGQTLTSQGQKDLETLQKDRPSATALDVLRGRHGDPTKVWLPEEIEFCQHHLTLFFLLTMFLLASSVVTVSQAAYCSTKAR